MDIKTICSLESCEKVGKLSKYILKERKVNELYWICEECYKNLNSNKQAYYIEVEGFHKYSQEVCQYTTIEAYINQFKKQIGPLQQQLHNFQQALQEIQNKIKEFENHKYNTQELFNKLKNNTIKRYDLENFFIYLKNHQKDTDDESNYKTLLETIDQINTSLEQYKYKTQDKVVPFSEIQSKLTLVDNTLGLQKFIDSVKKDIDLEAIMPYCYKRLAYDKIIEIQNNYYGCQKDNKKHGYGIDIQPKRVQLGVFIEDSFIWGCLFVLIQMNHYAYYVGHFKDNLLNGKGYWNQTKQENQKVQVSTYEGDMKFGMRDGQGKYQWPDGTIYDGSWKNNLKHGRGKLQYPNKQPQEVEYINDQTKQKFLQQQEQQQQQQQQKQQLQPRQISSTFKQQQLQTPQHPPPLIQPRQIQPQPPQRLQIQTQIQQPQSQTQIQQQPLSSNPRVASLIPQNEK